MQFQSIVNLRPIYVNPVQIGRLFGSIHPQFKANPGQFNLNPLSIHIHFDANPLSIQCQFAADSGQPTSNAAQIRPIYQSDFPMPIISDPIENQSGVKPVPTQFQSSANLGQSSANTTPLRHQSGGHLGQSIANPVPFQCQS